MEQQKSESEQKHLVHFLKSSHNELSGLKIIINEILMAHLIITDLRSLRCSSGIMSTGTSSTLKNIVPHMRSAVLTVKEGSAL